MLNSKDRCCINFPDIVIIMLLSSVEFFYDRLKKSYFFTEGVPIPIVSRGGPYMCQYP